MYLAILLLVAISFGTARSLLQDNEKNKVVPSLAVTVGTLYGSLVLTYFFSLFSASRRESVFNILRDVGGSLPSFTITIVFVILLPLTAMTLILYLWKNRKEILSSLKRTV